VDAHRSAVDGLETVQHDEQHQQIGQRSAQRSEQPVDLDGVRCDDGERDHDRNDDRDLHDQRTTATPAGHPQRHRRTRHHRAQHESEHRGRSTGGSGQHRHARERCCRRSPSGRTGDRRGGLGHRRLQPDLPVEDPHARPAPARRCVDAFGVGSSCVGSSLCSDRRPAGGGVLVAYGMTGAVTRLHGDVVSLAASFVEGPAQSTRVARIEVDEPPLVGCGQPVVHDQLVRAQRRHPVHRVRPVTGSPWSYTVDLAPVIAAPRGERTLRRRRGRFDRDRRSPCDRCDVHRVDDDRPDARPPDQAARPCDVDAHGQFGDDTRGLEASGDDHRVRGGLRVGRRGASGRRLVVQAHDGAVGQRERDPSALDRTHRGRRIDRDEQFDALADVRHRRRNDVCDPCRTRRAPSGDDLERHRDQTRGQQQDHCGGAGETGDRRTGDPGAEQRAGSGRPACRPDTPDTDRFGAVNGSVGHRHRIANIRSSAGRSRRGSRRPVRVRPPR
jgi:hypothetical protein